MDKSENVDEFRGQRIDKAITADEDLADVRLPELRNAPAAFSKSGKRTGCLANLVRERRRLVGRVFEDLLQDRFQVIPGRLSPNYTSVH